MNQPIDLNNIRFNIKTALIENRLILHYKDDREHPLDTHFIRQLYYWDLNPRDQGNVVRFQNYPNLPRINITEDVQEVESMHGINHQLYVIENARAEEFHLYRRITCLNLRKHYHSFLY